MPDVKKGTKDFTPAERAAILARAEKVDLSRVAKEFGTTWQAVAAMQRAAKQSASSPKASSSSRASRTRTRSLPGRRRAKVIPPLDPIIEALPQTDQVRKSKDFTPEQRNAVLALANQIGVAKAARRANTTKWVIINWKKNSEQGLPLSRQTLTRDQTIAQGKTEGAAHAPKTLRTLRAARAAAAQAQAAPVTSPVEVPAETPKPAAVSKSVRDTLEFENAILKDKVELLTEQVKKLRAAVASLA